MDKTTDRLGPGWDNVCNNCFGSKLEWPGMRRCHCTEVPAEPQWTVPGVPWAYYNPISDNFYERETRRGLGHVFYQGNIHRMREQTHRAAFTCP